MEQLTRQTRAIPPEITESLSRFKANHPEPQQTGFVVMRFQETPTHKRIIDAIRSALDQFGMKALRADDHQYHPDLYWNILTYIYGCGFGIAVFERIEQESFNPNVAFEVGYMLALGKPVCLLKERTLQTLQADLIGKLYRTFDASQAKSSISESIRKWLQDHHVDPPLSQANRFIEELSRREKYRDWSFRINWPLADASPRVDAFSKKTDCSELFRALLSAELGVTRHEFETVLEALKRVTGSAIPPKKLSGEILFAQTSKKVLDGVQTILGSTPYERAKERHTEWQDVLEEPKGLLPPRQYLIVEKNIIQYESAQERIAKTASHICKTVLCSTYQVSISQALHWEDPTTQQQCLAIACTARNRRKENIAAVGEIPVILTSASKSLVWYGQPDKRPTTEYQSHWCYHKLSFDRGTRKTFIAHFHPVTLLVVYESLYTRFHESIPDKFWRCAEKCVEDSEVFLRVFDRFVSVGARQSEFGEFMAEKVAEADNISAPYALIWKPDHGLWLITDGTIDHEEIRTILEKTEELSSAIVEVLNDA